MMMKHKFSWIILMQLCFHVGNSQTLFTAEQAVAEALQKNFGILLAKNELEIAQMQNTLGNAGFMPNVSVRASELISSNNIDQRFANGLVVVSDNVGSDNFSASVNLEWTIFDGLKMFATRNRLRETAFFSRTQLKAQIQQSVSEVLTSYYNAVKLKQQINASEKAIAIGEERLKIAENRLRVGASAKTDVLQAKIDLNTLLATLIRQKQDIKDAENELIFLLGRTEESELSVSDSIPIPSTLDPNSIKQKVLDNNPIYQSSLSQIKISEFMVKEARSFQFPTITFLSSYNYGRTSSEAGFALFNQNEGYNYGITATMPLFGGWNLQREKKVAKASLLSSRIMAEQTLAALQTEVIQANRALRNALDILELELENINYANENISIALEQFRLGTINTVQLKEAQNSFELVSFRLAEARYEAKIAEIALLRLSGELVR